MSADARPLVALACGLRAEAKIAAGAGVIVVPGGGDAAALTAALEAAVAAGCRAVLSFGIAGGLVPDLRPGDCRVARGVIAVVDGALYPTDARWTERLAAALGGASTVLFAGVDAPLGGVADKVGLHHASGAALVDMESHVAARVAIAHGLPFAAVRVVADAADRSLPHAATVGMRPDGHVAIGAVLLSLVRDPRQVPALVGTARDARAAFAGLLRSRQSLPAAFGFSLGVNDGETVLDML